MTKLTLPNGYYELPKGKLVNLVTCLEMNLNPQREPLALPEGYSLQKVDPTNLQAYRETFKAIGQDLMWFSRVIMTDQELQAILSNPEVESYVLYHANRAVGLMELNFRELPNCELAFFGLTSEQIGTGISRVLMSAAITKAWVKPIDRFWVHTCHYDHPNAVRFYKKSGFTPYTHMIEIHDDARITGHLPPEASPQIALIKP
jgi:GNAT superfamily N-acetyltransferase